MSIPVSLNRGGAAASIDNSSAGADKVKPRDPAADLTPANKARLQLNASIMQASLTVSLSTQNDPLALVYKSAITSINEALQGQYGDNAIENAMSQDNTAQGTADRIVSLSTGFFDAFKQQHPGEDEDVVLNKFMDTLRGGVETGFKEARSILSGMDVLGGDIAGNIDKTYELIQKGYADFEAAHGKKPSETAQTKP